MNNFLKPSLILILISCASLGHSAVTTTGTRLTTFSGSAGLEQQFFSANTGGTNLPCTSCHNSGWLGYDWSNYNDANTFSASIATRIALNPGDAGFMPSGGNTKVNATLFNSWVSDSKPNIATPYIAQGANSTETRQGQNDYDKSVTFIVNENGANGTYTAYYRKGADTWSTVSGSDPGGASLNGGSGASGSDGTSTATLTNLVCGNTYTYYLRGDNDGNLFDGTYTNSVTNTFSITCLTGTSLSGSPGSVDEDSTINWTPTKTSGTGGSGGTKAYSFSVGPTVTGGNTANVPTINPTSGQVSWTPSEGNTSASFTISVSDTASDTSANTLARSITANPINNKTPVISNSNVSPFGGQENLAMTPIQFTATDADAGDTQTWSLTAQDDPGMSLSGTGEFNWTPPEGAAVGGNGSGLFQFTVQATDTATPNDGSLHSTTKTFSIQVVADNSAPSIDSTPTSQAAIEDIFYSVDLNATDSDIPDTQNWSITAPIGLDDMSIDTNGTLRWTPGEGVDRTQNVTIRVTDGGGEFDEVSFDIDVTAVNDPPVFSETSLPINNDSVEEHSLFSYAVQVTDSDPLDNTPDLDSNMTYSITNVSPTPTSTTPSIDATGLITWTPGNNDARSVDPAALSQDYVISVSVADGGENSQGPATQNFTLTITLQDGDSDTVPDYEDNCPVDANTTQDNNDLDSEGDVCDPDDDNDGISDIAENFNGLDPFNNADAALDLDGDGLSNLTEFNTCTGTDINSLLTCDNIQIDSVPPIITHNGDFNLLAAGYTTFVDFSATATDGNDGVVDVTADTSNKFFRPGDNVVTWTAQDAVPNVAIDEQYITIHPLVSLGGSQVLAEGSSGTAYINFNGDIPAADFPVSIAYVVSGTSVTAGDYNITPASPIILNSQGDLTNGQVALNISATNDGFGEGSEIMNITLNSITAGPEFGLDTMHRVMITEAQVAPTVNLVAEQNGIIGNVIFGDQGSVTVNANAIDGNGDGLSYDWSGSDAALGGSGAGGTFTFNPSSSVVPESFTVNVIVSDGTFNISQSLSLVYAADSLALGGSDTDGDGIDDATEGLNDSDGDGIPDFLDAFDNSLNLLFSGNNQGADEGPEFIQTESGLSLALGSIGMESNVTNPNINLIKMTNQGLVVSDTGYVHFGSIYDFSITGLTLVSNSAQVVIPTDQGITPEAEIRLFDPVLGVWFTFVENASNSVSSAQSDENGCPAPGDASYTTNLTAYNNCIQLTISDGGPNDLDGEINGQILVIAGLAVIDTADLFEPVIVIDESNLFGSDGPEGTGALNIIFEMFLMTVLGASFYRRRKLQVHRKNLH